MMLQELQKGTGQEKIRVASGGGPALRMKFRGMRWLSRPQGLRVRKRAWACASWVHQTFKEFSIPLSVAGLPTT